MRIKFIEQLKFKMSGRKVPVIVAQDISEDGKIRSLFIQGDLRKRDNSIVNTWDEKTYEIKKDAGPIPVTDPKGNLVSTYIVSESGKSINLYTEPRTHFNASEILGRFSMADDIADNMVLGKSMRNLMIGLLVGIGIGAFFVGPLIQQMMK